MNLVSLIGYCVTGSQRLLVYEFLPNKTLRNSSSKVYPAMYIDNVTELAFDDIAPARFSIHSSPPSHPMGYTAHDVSGFLQTRKKKDIEGQAKSPLLPNFYPRRYILEN
ncbi:hypothetical protein YC2023_015650 [Brassica napus]